MGRENAWASSLVHWEISMAQWTIWAIPPVRLGLSGRNSGKIPERPWKRSQSVSWNFPREYGWDAPSPTIQGIWGFQSVSRILSPPVRLGTPPFFRIGSGEGLSELVMEFLAVLGVVLTIAMGGHIIGISKPIAMAQPIAQEHVAKEGPTSRRRTNVQQLTCKIDLSSSLIIFSYLLFSLS